MHTRNLMKEDNQQKPAILKSEVNRKYRVGHNRSGLVLYDKRSYNQMVLKNYLPE